MSRAKTPARGAGLATCRVGTPTLGCTPEGVGGNNSDHGPATGRSDSLSAGRVFGDRYRGVRRLGAGGSGAVFLAHDELLDRHVAVKRLHGAEVTAATAVRLRREARIMASLRHPNLVAAYDMVLDGDDVLLVMEYVPGETLADVLRDGPIEWERAFALLSPVAAALDYAHESGVVHRDLKPSNIL